MISYRCRAGRWSVAAIGALAIAVAGCTGKPPPGPTTYVTVPAPTAPASSSTTAAPSAATTAPTSVVSSAPAVPTERAMTRLPGACDTTIPLGSVVDALGRTVKGGTAFVVGPADATIDRLSYINCRYGVAKGGSDAAIEIGVSLYRSPAKAAARISPTVADYEQHAARATRTSVKGRPATVLNGGTGAGYGPTIVLAAGQRTIAVSIRPGVGDAARVVKDLSALAALAAERTGSG